MNTNVQGFRTVIDATTSTVSEVQAGIARSRRSAQPLPFLVRLEVSDDRVMRGWARVCDDSLASELLDRDLADALRDEHRVPLAMEESAHSAAAALSLLETKTQTMEFSEARSLLLLDLAEGNPEPDRLFTRDTASVGDTASAKLELSAGLPYNTREMHDRTLVCNAPVLLEVRLGGPREGDQVDIRELLDASKLLNRTVRIEAQGTGITFPATGSSTWQSESHEVGDGTEALIDQVAFSATEATAEGAKATILIRLFAVIDAQHPDHGVPAAELVLEFTAVESMADIGLPASMDVIASAPVWPGPWPIILRPDRSAGEIHYTADGGDKTIVMDAPIEVFSSDRYGKQLALLTRDFSRNYYPPEASRPLVLDDNLAQTRVLARIGQTLHQMVFGFEGNKANEAARQFFAEQKGGSLWVRDRQPNLLWELFFDGDAETTNAEELHAGFWGYRFQIEHIPDRRDDEASVRGSLLSSPASARMFVHQAAAESAAKSGANEKELARGIDERAAAEHDGLANLLASTHRGERTPRLLEWISGETVETAVLYLFGHGKAGTKINPANGMITFHDPYDLATIDLGENGGKVTMLELLEYLPQVDALPGYPVVFLNACETMLVDPLYDNPFIKAFYKYGHARGVIGAVAEVPVQFAVGFAHQVLERFFAGVPIGTALHSVKRELLEAGNPYGLLYTLYGSSATTVMEAAQ